MKNIKEQIVYSDFKGISHYPQTLLIRILKYLLRYSNVYLHRGEGNKEDTIAYFQDILDNPTKYLESEYKELAQIIIDNPHSPVTEIELLKEPIPYSIYGKDNIENSTIEQMNIAMRLPITKGGSLMPDAHLGYGLPIGGVLATNANVVIPYAVGNDIACRMCLSIYPINGDKLNKDKDLLTKVLVENTLFGNESCWDNTTDHHIFDEDIWNNNAYLKGLKDKAYKQLGSSGSGNHFVDIGIIELFEEIKDLPKGEYLALLSHSGSRGLGANIADYYTKIAKEKCRLPIEADNLAWLELDTQAGQDYWEAMNLAGEYASANHHVIHSKISKALNLRPFIMIENHHNFAWKEILNGEEVIVHRKGATPANKWDLGIIPGSCTQSGYVVRGKGNEDSINSSSHGAGRLLSRNTALKSFTKEDMNKALNDSNVVMIGGDLDEAPMAYKDIDKVMEYQKDLVHILAKFNPKIVRMDDSKKINKN